MAAELRLFAQLRKMRWRGLDPGAKVGYGHPLAKAGDALSLTPRAGIFASRPAPGQDRRATLEDDVLSHSDPATGLPVGPRPARVSAANTLPGAAEQPSSEGLLAEILASLDDDKAEDVVQIDLRGRSDMADYMVICSGRSSRQVAAISEKLMDRLKTVFGRLSKVEGKETGDWVLIDTGDVIVHVFRPEVREFYQLEKMWLPAEQQRSTIV
jgi:ribosome-associated protein